MGSSEFETSLAGLPRQGERTPAVVAKPGTVRLGVTLASAALAGVTRTGDGHGATVTVIVTRAVTGVRLGVAGAVLPPTEPQLPVAGSVALRLPGPPAPRPGRPGSVTAQ